MKNQYFSSKLIALFSIAFALLLTNVQTTNAQRYLSEIRNGSEARGIATFADDLSEFLTFANYIEQENATTPADLRKLESLGKKVKDGTSNLRNNLKNLVTLLKNQNRWDDSLDTEINDLFGTRKIRGFFQRHGGRKILTDADTAINGLSNDVDTIIKNAGKPRSSLDSDGIFIRTSFASKNSGRKLTFKCAVLGVAIFGAELLKAKKTAENLDGFFDKGCGAGASTAT